MERHSDMAVFDRFGDWREAICDLVMDVSARKSTDAPSFRASIGAVRLGPASMIRFASAPHSIERDHSRIRQSGRDDFLVSFQRHGRAEVACGDRRFVLDPGAFAVVDCASPFALRFIEPVTRQVARIPRELFAAATGLDRLADGLHLAGATLALRLLRHHFTEIAVESEDLSAAVAFDLCRAVKAALSDEKGNARPDVGLWRRIAGLVSERLADPDFGLGAAAGALGISVRTLQRECARHGVTFGGYLLGRRLDAAAAQLADPRYSDCAVTTLAYRWGFNDTAHFSRAFRARFARSPSQYRVRRQ